MKRILLIGLLGVCGVGCKKEAPKPEMTPGNLPAFGTQGELSDSGVEANGSVAPIGWKAYGVINADGTTHLAPERTYDVVCPPGYEPGGPKDISDGWSIDTDSLKTNARCYPPRLKKGKP